MKIPAEIIVVIFIVLGCATTRPSPETLEKANQIRIVKGRPPKTCKDLGLIEVKKTNVPWSAARIASVEEYPSANLLMDMGYRTAGNLFGEYTVFTYRAMHCDDSN